MHVCFFNRSYWPDIAATGQLLTELAEDLVAHHGWEVTVVAGYPLRSDHRLPKDEIRNGVRIIRAAGTTRDPARFSGRASNYVTYFASACVAALRIRTPDVVLALTDPPIIGLAGLLAARRARAPFVYLTQDVFPEVARLLEDFHNETLNTALDRINRFLLRRADAVLALGDTMRRRLIEEKGADGGKITVIHNWADCAALTPGPRDNAFAREHGLTGRFVVMHAGNIGLSQNLDVVIAAAERLRDHGDIRFVFLGEGARRQILQRMARDRGLDNVIFIPFRPRGEMSASYAAADVFIISLKQGIEGYIVPSKVYSVLAAGKPYIAAIESASEVADIAREYRCGVVVPPGDVDALAARVLELSRDRAQVDMLGSRARQAGLQFDRPRAVAAYSTLLREVARGRVGADVLPGMKRLFDLVASGLGLIVLSPLWPLAAIAITLEDGGPVFFPQVRVGRGGRPFTAYKFRSMIAGADAIPRQATAGDERVTRVGRVLRATAMDELPQLWNIFRGDMSVVGPRPLVPGEIEADGSGGIVALDGIPGYERRHAVRPGLTGLTQVFAPRDVRPARKFRLDLLYVKHANLCLDLRLVFLSFWITLRGRWEHRGRKV